MDKTIVKFTGTSPWATWSRSTTGCSSSPIAWACQMFPVPTPTGGQKFEARVDSLDAIYSYKYFGKGEGVSVYTFRDERDLL
jgi:hypothetical protein